MKRWTCAVMAVALAGGCSAPATSAPPAARSGMGSVSVPDPCTLLSRDDVTELTHRDVTQIDHGDGYCQWQQEDGQLAVFVSRTDPAEFHSTVDGIGDGACWSSGHLYVLYGTLQIDVYSRGGDDLPDAKRVAETVITRL